MSIVSTSKLLPLVLVVDRSQALRCFSEVLEVLRSDLSAKMPPSLTLLMSAELQGYTWNFETGTFEAVNS